MAGGAEWQGDSSEDSRGESAALQIPSVFGPLTFSGRPIAVEPFYPSKAHRGRPGAGKLHI